MKTLRILKNKKGFTLLEIVVVLAIIALVMSGVAYSINAGKKSSKANDIAQKMRTVETGLYEYKSAKGTLPAQATMGNFPTALGLYIPSEITSIFKYKCDSTTNQAVIRTDAMSDSAEASDTATRLQNMNLCSTATANSDKTVDCVLKSLDGSAKCT